MTTTPTAVTAQQPEIQYSHSLKLEETAKGVRIAVHVYAHDGDKVIEEAFNTYLKARMVAEDNRIPLAPVDTGDSKK